MNRLPIIRPVFDERELEYLRQCLASGHVTQGPFTAAFEKAFAKFQQTDFATAVTSCTTALHLALLALGVGPGDEVLVPSLTFVATANAVEYTGARPVIVDVLPDSYCIDPDAARKALSAATKAVIPVHLFGLCADMDAILALAGEHGLLVLEDAACAAGSSYKGRSAGTMGSAGCFSFHPRKVITTGEGGMIITNDAALDEKLRILRNHGASPMPPGSEAWFMPAYHACGFNYRLSDIQAAVGCAQMEKINDILAERARIAALYSRILADEKGLVLPNEPAKCTHSWQSYVLRFQKGRAQRDAVAKKMAAAGIEVRCGTHAVHRLDYYARKYSIGPEDCPVAALCEDSTLALPVTQGMSEEDVLRVAACFR